MQINYFISHSWQYSKEYETLCKWITDANDSATSPYTFENLSVPKNHPIHNANNEQELKKAIY